MKQHNSFFLMIAVLLLCISCQPQTSDRPTITVTIEPLRYIAEQIAGDKFQVVTLVPNGSSPETYEPTAQQLVDLTRSELYIQVGELGFERTWTKRLRANAQHLIVVDSSEGIQPVDCNDHSCSDPHTWTSPTNVLQIARNVYQAMVMIDKKDSIYFRSNLDSLCSKVIKIDAQIENMLENIPNRSFLIYHPALTYFAHDYQLRQLALENEGKEPSAASLKQLVAQAQQDSVHLMFVQKEFANRNVETVCKATGAKQVEINPLSYDWCGEMLKIAKAICNQ